MKKQSDSRIETSCIPRPTSLSHTITEPGGKRMSADFAGPPPSHHAFVSYVEQTSATPRYIRTSLTLLPQCKSTLVSSKIPLTLLFHPFPSLSPYECPPSTSDLSPYSPHFLQIPAPVWNDGAKANQRPQLPRCKDCGAYVNPFFTFALTEMTCNLCGTSTEIPEFYLTLLEQHRDVCGSEYDFNQRLASQYDQTKILPDLEDPRIRPELLRGCYDLRTHFHPSMASLAISSRPALGANGSSGGSGTMGTAGTPYGTPSALPQSQLQAQAQAHAQAMARSASCTQLPNQHPHLPPMGAGYPPQPPPSHYPPPALQPNQGLPANQGLGGRHSNSYPNVAAQAYPQDSQSHQSGALPDGGPATNPAASMSSTQSSASLDQARSERVLNELFYRGAGYSANGQDNDTVFLNPSQTVLPQAVPGFVCLIDCSPASIASGFFKVTLNALRELPHKLAQKYCGDEDRSKHTEERGREYEGIYRRPNVIVELAVIAFDDSIHLYGLDKQQKIKSIRVVAELEAPFLPLPASSLTFRLELPSTSSNTSELAGNGIIVSNGVNEREASVAPVSLAAWLAYLDRIESLNVANDNTSGEQSAISSSGATVDSCSALPNAHDSARAPTQPLSSGKCAMAALAMGVELLEQRWRRRTMAFPVRGGTLCLFATADTVLGLGRAANPGKATSAEASPFILGSEMMKTMVQRCGGGGLCVEAFLADLERWTLPSRLANTHVFASPTPKSQAGRESDHGGFDHIYDVAYLTGQTGGRLAYYKTFLPELYETKLCEDVWRVFTGNSGADCALKIRCSKGLSIKQILCPWSCLSSDSGGGFGSDASQFQIPKLHLDSQVTFELDYKKDEIEGNSVYVQIAFTYTNVRGIRCIRIINKQIFLTSTLTTVFRHSDVDPVLAFYKALLLKGVLENRYEESKAAVIQSLTQILLSYRLHSSFHSPLGQLILPESLKLVPVYLTGLFKSSALRKAAGVKPAERVAELFELLTKPLTTSARLCYPFTYPIHRSAVQLKDEIDLEIVGTKNSIADFVYMPVSVPASGQTITTDGIFLMDCGTAFFVYVAAQVDAEALSALHLSLAPASAAEKKLLIGPEEAAALSELGCDTRSTQEQHNHNDLLRRIWRIVAQLRREKLNAPYQPVFVIQAGSASEPEFIWRLSEDRLGGEKGYVDFLCEVSQRF